MMQAAAQRAAPKVPAWRLVFRRQLAEIWLGRTPVLIILYSVFLGVWSFLLASNSELSLIPPKEMVNLCLQASLATGLFVCLIIGADSISGERERGSLEELLLTPISRRHLVLGKLLASISPWPVILVVTIPFLALLSPNPGVLMTAVVWGGIVGTALVVGFTAIGVLISARSESNRTSLSVSMTIFLLLMIPTQMPGSTQLGAVGRFFKWINPSEASVHFLEKILVNNRTVAEMSVWLFAPFALAIFGVLVLFTIYAPRLRLAGGRPQ